MSSHGTTHDEPEGSAAPGPAAAGRIRGISNRIVLVGEARWLREDVRLIAAVLPHLPRMGGALAVEVFAASEQGHIDTLLAAPKWNATAANAIMRTSDWPYRDHRDLLHVAWEQNRRSSADSTLQIVALGPPADWRQSLLPNGTTHDGFMANRVIAALSGRTRRVLVYCGMHPAFTRYVEAELELRGHATNYVDRMDNLLWWRYGEWSQPLEVVRLVDLIPLDEYAPDEASTGEVARHNPFTDESGLTHAQLRQRWSREAAANADALGKRGWANLELAPPLSPVTGLRAVDGCWENR